MIFDGNEKEKGSGEHLDTFEIYKTQIEEDTKEDSHGNILKRQREQQRQS